MTNEIMLAFTLLAITIALFASGKLRLDIISLLLLIALMLTGLLTPAQAFGGFGDPLVMMIVALFVIGEALLRTGVAVSAGNWLVSVAGASETRLLVMLMLVVAVLSAFMSNTGAVAIFIPVAANLARQANIPVTRLLLPMAYAGSIGGMLTLIGTPPNLAVSTELSRSGYEAFGFFSFTPIGLAVLAVAIVFIVLFGKALMPKSSQPAAANNPRPSMKELGQDYGVPGIYLIQLAQTSPLVGQNLYDVHLRSHFGVTVLALERGEGRNTDVMTVSMTTRYQAGDILMVTAPVDALDRLSAEYDGLDISPYKEEHGNEVKQELGVVEVLLTPRSGLLGQTIKSIKFRDQYNLTVVGLMRRGKAVSGDLLDQPLQFGDSLLVAGGWVDINLLQGKTRDVSVLTLPREVEEVAPYRKRAPWALGVVVIMLVVLTLSSLAPAMVVLVAAVAMVLARCVTMEEAYRAINWPSVVLIASMLPMAVALEQTGALSLVVETITSTVGGYGPLVLMAALFVLTAIFSQFISNTATAVLLAPVAVGASVSLGVAPQPLLMTVALAASTAFATPMASPTNTLVMGPGNYQFMDFVRMGVPLQLLALVVTLLGVPLLFPLY